MANAMGEGEFRPPASRKPQNHFDETRIFELYPENHSPCKISFQSDDVGGLANAQIATIRFLSLFYWSLRHAHRSHRRTDFVFSPKDVPFGGFIDTLLDFGGQNLQNATFGGVNRYFRA